MKVILRGDKEKFIERALKWLDENEPKWNLDKPIDREEYIRGFFEDDEE